MVNICDIWEYRPANQYWRVWRIKNDIVFGKRCSKSGRIHDRYEVRLQLRANSPSLEWRCVASNKHQINFYGSLKKLISGT